MGAGDCGITSLRGLTRTQPKLVPDLGLPLPEEADAWCFPQRRCAGPEGGVRGSPRLRSGPGFWPSWASAPVALVSTCYKME